MLSAEAHVSLYLAPICGNGWGAAARHSNCLERRGCDFLSSALRVAWICTQMDALRNSPPSSRYHVRGAAHLLKAGVKVVATPPMLSALDSSAMGSIVFLVLPSLSGKR